MPPGRLLGRDLNTLRGPADTLDTVSASVPTDQSYADPEVRLQIEDRYNSEAWITHRIARAREIVRGQDGADDTCRITIDALDADDLDEGHFAAWIERFSTDLRVRVTVPSGDAGHQVLFQGWCQPVTIAWTETRQSMSVTALSEGQERLRVGKEQQILGRRMVRDPLADVDWESVANPETIVVGSLPTVFNAGGKPNRAAEPLPFNRGEGQTGSHAIYLFVEDNAPDAEYWTYAQALRYLAYFYIFDADAGVSAAELLSDTDDMAWDDPVPGSADPFIRRISARAIDVVCESMHVEAAIGVLCAAAGLHYHVPVRSVAQHGGVRAEWYLRICATAESEFDEPGTLRDRLMRTPQVRDLPRAAPFTDYSSTRVSEVAALNAVQKTLIVFDPRAFNTILARGAPIEYEVTLLLRPGWLPHSRLDNLCNADQEDRDDAIEFWRDEFEPEFDADLDPTARIPYSVYHGAHPSHAAHADVFRLWVFPDDHRLANQGLGRDGESAPNDPESAIWLEQYYSPFMDQRRSDGEPKDLWWQDAALGGGLPHDVVTHWTPRRRPPRNTIGRANHATSDTSPIVRVCFDGESPETALSSGHWIDFAGQVEIDTERMAIRIVDHNIWGSAPFLAEPEIGAALSATAIERYIEGKFYVSITCSVRGDRRLAVEKSRRVGFRRERVAIVDYGANRFLRRLQHEGNSSLPTDEDPAFATRDDESRFKAAADRDLEQISKPTVSGDPEIFYLDPTWWPCDSVRGVDGLGISFPTWPTVQMVRLVDGDGGWRTYLHLSDMRDAPEVGSE